MSYAFWFILFFLFPFYNFKNHQSDELIVWYVGQGQMVTYSSLKTCIHFDMGGEIFPIKSLIRKCGDKENQVFFSHWDWDHINFARKAWKRLFSFCRLNTPGGLGNERKKTFLSIIPFCDSAQLIKAKQIFRELSFPISKNRSKKARSANKYSRVVVVRNKVLIPGDSPGSSEILWLDQIKDPIEILVVSHHGSRYSTTLPLLKRLPYLKLAIASARRKRYGHPHILVKKRLVGQGVSLLSTEDFHHIRIPLCFRACP